jgi:hypothetical protein
MSNTIQYNSSYEKSRWVGFFDLLGIRRIIKNRDSISVFVLLSGAIEEVKRRLGTFEDVGYAWFSDSFLFYTNDESFQSFSTLHHICRWFCFFLITPRQIPVRGSISCSSLYVDRENDLFFGKALVEAYEYEEAQDWIGFILCPSAEMQLKALGHPAHGIVDYVYTSIPFNKRGSKLENNLPACVLGQWHGPENPCIESLIGMRDRATDSSIIQKYENTIRFIESNERSLPFNDH